MAIAAAKASGTAEGTDREPARGGMIDLARRHFIFGLAAVPAIAVARKHFIMPKRDGWWEHDFLEGFRYVARPLEVDTDDWLGGTKVIMGQVVARTATSRLFKIGATGVPEFDQRLIEVLPGKVFSLAEALTA